MVIDLTWENVALNVISWPTCAIAKLNTIAKIYKYRGLNEGHHFIPMTIEVQGALRCDWIVSLGNVPLFFLVDDREVIYPCFLHSIFQVPC